LQAILQAERFRIHRYSEESIESIRRP